MTAETMDVDAIQEVELIELFASRLNQTLDLHSYPRVQIQRISKLAADLDVSVSGARKWCVGVAIPSPGTLTKIARRFNVSVDYLLGLRENRVAPNCKYNDIKSVEIPLYSLAGSSVLYDDSESPLFRKLKSIYVECDPAVAHYKNLSLLESWIDLPSMSIRKGDALLVDTSAKPLIDDGIYLLRTKSMICLRRFVARMDGKIEMTTECGSCNGESSCVGPNEITHNSSGNLNESGPSQGVKIIGRVIAKFLKIDPRIPGFI